MHADRDSRALFPLKSRLRRPTDLAGTGAVALLGFSTLGAFSLLTLFIFSGELPFCAFCLGTKPWPGTLGFFCQKIGLTYGRFPNPSDVFRLFGLPDCWRFGQARVYAFHRENATTSPLF
jgi:hypothetical protein